MKYSQAVEYLNSFINYEKNSFFPYKGSLKLARVFDLFKALEIPYQKLKCIHIAGTKGKGSTAQFCADILAASGYKVGLYTSPHFFDFRERIKIVKSLRSKVREVIILEKDVLSITEDMKPVLEKIRKDKKLGGISFFEAYTALAFKYFLDQKCDYVVLETGLGGRLDATNIVKPLVSVITHIGYDHMDKLGDTLVKIAAEKAGIIKKNVPVVCAPQAKEVLEVIKQKADKLNAPVFLVGKDIKINNLKIKSEFSSFDLISKKLSLINLKIRLKGAAQIENAACAIAAVALIDKKAKFKQGLALASLSGRFEIIKQKPLTVVDVAHNSSSFAAVLDNMRRYFPGKKITLIFGCSQDKDAAGMLKIFPYHRLILCGFDNSRAANMVDMKNKLGLTEARLAFDISRAYEIAKEGYDKNSVILIAGSFFLVTEAMGHIKNV
jgi:dihydrofolate synthase / folylpolyglutamate synthase